MSELVFFYNCKQKFKLVCKPAYLVPVPSQDKLAGLCKERHPA